ncbi:MAG: DUF4440 domain-containing protein [Flavobacteriales bacterium]|nr:DUF4440 domain-containing protein [Flavobacteriales bacterium]
MNKLSTLISALIFVCILTVSCEAPQKDLKQHLSDLMNAQSDYWNDGNIEGFMEYYWKSDSLLFIGGSGPQYGWQNTLDRYKSAYPNREIMGQLHFEMLTFKELSNDAALISGKWHLDRVKGDAGGYYSLLWKRIDGNWKIVYDHTSIK